MRDWIKALPLGLGLPLVIGAASVKPEDAASNVAAWLHATGIEHVPGWLNGPNVDSRVILGSLSLGMIYAFLIWGVPAIRRLDHAEKPKGASTPDLPACAAEIEAFCNSWLWEAAKGADQILRFVITEVFRHPKPEVKNQAGLIQKSISDEERTALALLQNALRGIEPTTDDDLQERLGKYYRAYQSCRTWIVLGSQSAHIPIGKNVVFRSWLKSDEQFLVELRRFAGPAKFVRLRREIQAVGFGEGITLELDKLSKS
jgi:hypothetical protein